MGNKTVLVDEENQEIEKDTVFERLKEIKTVMRRLFTNQKPLEDLLKLCKENFA